MIVTNLTDEALGIKGVSVPAGQSRKVRGFNPDGRRERELLASGAISAQGISTYGAVAEPEEPEPEPAEDAVGRARRWFTGDDDEQ